VRRGLSLLDTPGSTVRTVINIRVACWEACMRRMMHVSLTMVGG